MLESVASITPNRSFTVHRSTIVVALLLTTLMLVVNIPGIFIDGQCSGCIDYLREHPEVLADGDDSMPTSLMEHGWPWGFLRRLTLSEEFSDPLLGIPWMSWSAWTDWDAECDLQFVPKYLLYDLCLALAIVAVFSIGWEWRRRRRNRLLQFRISDMLVVTTVIAACLSWYVFQRKASAEEEPHVVFLEGDYSNVYMLGMDSSILELSNRLLGFRPYSLIPDRVTRVRFEGLQNDPIKSWEEAVTHLRALGSLVHLEIAEFQYVPDFPFSRIAELRQLHTLQLRVDYAEKPIDVELAQELAQLQQISRLVVYEKDDITVDAQQLLAEKMPNCEVVYLEDDPLAWRW